MNDVNNQYFEYTFARQPTAFVFDPNNDIVLKTATTTLNTALQNISLSADGDQNHNVDQSEKMEYSIPDSDINNDGVVDAADVDLVRRDLLSFVSGYVDTDLNKDGSVDATDMAIVQYISSINFFVSNP
jgi:hypothetical protein